MEKLQRFLTVLRSTFEPRHAVARPAFAACVAVPYRSYSPVLFGKGADRGHANETKEPPSAPNICQIICSAAADAGGLADFCRRAPARSSGLPLSYALQYCLFVALVVGPLVRAIKRADREGMDAVRSSIKLDAERLRETAPSPEQISEHAGVTRRFVSSLLQFLHGAFVTPTIYLKIAFGVRPGARVAYWPDLDRPWSVFCVVIAFSLAATHHPVVGPGVSVHAVAFSTVRSHVTLRDAEGVAEGARIQRAPSRAFPYCFCWRHDRCLFWVHSLQCLRAGPIRGCLVLLFGVNLAMTVWPRGLTEVGTASGSAAVQSTQESTRRGNR